MYVNFARLMGQLYSDRAAVCTLNMAAVLWKGLQYDIGVRGGGGLTNLPALKRIFYCHVTIGLLCTYISTTPGPYRN